MKTQHENFGSSRHRQTHSDTASSLRASQRAGCQTRRQVARRASDMGLPAGGETEVMTCCH